MNNDAQITDPVVTFKVNQTYREGMSAEELYEITRGIWKVGERSEKARYAFAVNHGKIIEVYEISKWSPAGTHEYIFRKHDPAIAAARREFSGKVADDTIRDKYLGKYIHTYQTVNYFNCPK